MAKCSGDNEVKINSALLPEEGAFEVPLLQPLSMASVPVSLFFVAVVFLGFCSKFVCEIKTFGEELSHASLTVGNVLSHHKLSIDPHVVN